MYHNNQETTCFRRKRESAVNCDRLFGLSQTKQSSIWKKIKEKNNNNTKESDSHKRI